MAQLFSLGHIAHSNMTAIVIIIIEFLFTVAILILAVAKLITAITAFRIAARVSSAVAQTQTPATKRGEDKTDLFFFAIGVVGMFVGIGGLVWLLSQADGPATKHEIVGVAMCLVNVVTGNLILTTMTIKKYVA